jgi:hypothetical protein
VAIRRSLRVGALAGTPVEDLGVQPDELHRMTRKDVLEGNVDLLDRAGELLAALPARRLDAAADLGADGMLRLEIEVEGVDRADIYVDQRPRASVDLSEGQATVKIEGVADGATVLVEGFADGNLVAARRLEL